jgi:hypothetical protein
MGQAVLGIRIWRIRMFLGLQDPNPDTLVRNPDPDASLSEIMLAKQVFKTEDNVPVFKL